MNAPAVTILMLGIAGSTCLVAGVVLLCGVGYALLAAGALLIAAAQFLRRGIA